MEQLSHNHPDNSDELLSAYIDNAVDAGERRRAEQYIAACAACAQEVQELRMFRALLRELPNVQPRRSFTLDPATVAPQRRLLFPTLRWSSLVAALLFVVVLGVDVLGGNAPNTLSSMPMGAPAAAPAGDSSAKSGTQFDNAGGSAESMALPQESPPAPIGADQANPEDAPLTAQAPAESAAASPEAAIAEASASPEANDAAIPQASPAASGYAPPVAAAASPAASAAPSPAMARNSQTPAALADPAGGNSAELPQRQFQADEPAAANTIELAPNARAQGSWWSIYGLRVAEVALGLIALVLGGAAVWTWRRQL